MDDVLRCLAEMGGMYPEVVELVRQVGNFQCVTCPIVCDALPQAVSVYELAKGAAEEPSKTDQEIRNAQNDFGATPTLYEKTSTKSPRHVSKESPDGSDRSGHADG